VVRRLLTGLLIGVVAVGAVAGLLAVLASRENATTDASSASAPGVAAPAAVSADLRRGNVVVLAAAGELPAARAVARAVAGPPDPALREAGQAVLVRRSAGPGVRAQAWHRELRVASARDPRLRAFAEFWLGRGAG